METCWSARGGGVLRPARPSRDGWMCGYGLQSYGFTPFYKRRYPPAVGDEPDLGPHGPVSTHVVNQCESTCATTLRQCRRASNGRSIPIAADAHTVCGETLRQVRLRRPAAGRT